MATHYDTGTKVWTTVLGLILMLLVQWPALFTARMQSPPDLGNQGWNLFACVLGLVAPVAWLALSVRNRSNSVYGWGAVVVLISVWAAISVAWVTP